VQAAREHLAQNSAMLQLRADERLAWTGQYELMLAGQARFNSRPRSGSVFCLSWVSRCRRVSSWSCTSTTRFTSACARGAFALNVLRRRCRFTSRVGSSSNRSHGTTEPSSGRVSPRNAPAGAWGDAQCRRVVLGEAQRHFPAGTS